MRTLPPVLLLLVLAACQKQGGTATDNDGDGYVFPLDCDDSNASVNPEGEEECNGLDDDCNHLVDDGAPGLSTYLVDADGDGFGDPATSVEACEQAPGLTTVGDDCDDTDPLVNPIAQEVCADGLDNNCDGDMGDCPMEGDGPAASLAHATLLGDAANDQAGGGVSFAGDVNGDGYDDIAVGAIATAGYTGGVAVFLGPVEGTHRLSEAHAWFSGEAPYAMAGAALDGMGDVDADGLDDLLVGSGGSNEGGSYAGAVYVLKGPLTGPATLAAADVRLPGVGSMSFTGSAVAGFDTDADGYPEVLAGSPGDTAGSGREAVYLLRGPVARGDSLQRADWSVQGSGGETGLGSALDDAGDTDGDGFHEVLVGQFSLTGGGGVLVFDADEDGDRMDTDADAFVDPSTGDEALGTDVAGVGDVNGDGLDDILVGGSGAGGTGAAWLFLGPLPLAQSVASAHATLTGTGASDYAGSDVAGAGDLDRDGFADLLVGAPGADSLQSNAGMVYLVRGPVSGVSPLAGVSITYAGSSSWEGLGAPIDGGGDANDDGYADWLAGAAYGNTGGNTEGQAYLFYGTGP